MTLKLAIFKYMKQTTKFRPPNQILAEMSEISISQTRNLPRIDWLNFRAFFQKSKMAIQRRST